MIFFYTFVTRQLCTHLVAYGEGAPRKIPRFEERTTPVGTNRDDMNKRLKERSVTYYEIIFTYFVKFATLKRLRSNNMFSTFSRSPLIRCTVHQLKHTQVTLQFSLKGPHCFFGGWVQKYSWDKHFPLHVSLSIQTIEFFSMFFISPSNWSCSPKPTSRITAIQFNFQ